MSARTIRRKRMISARARQFGLVIGALLLSLAIVLLITVLANPFSTVHKGAGVGLSALAVLLGGGLIYRLVNLVSSYTGQVERQTSDTVSKMEGKFKTLIQNSLDLITIIDTKGIVLYQSPSSERILGYLPDELLNQSIFELVHAEDHALMQNVLEQKSSTFFFSYRIQHRDGTWLYFEAAGTNLVDNPLIKGYILNSRDITDRKKEEEVRRKKEMAAVRADAERERAENERRIIAESKAQLEEAYHIIEHKNQEITDSINYAFRIQTALLPSIEQVKTLLPNAFVFWRPKDIVSGDFYWFARRGSLSLIAAADCTGHGVPGAFMTMIGNTLLNRIVLELGIVQPDEILNALHIGVRTSLKQDQTTSRDGMDIVFAAINHETNQLQFAAANNPLVRVRGGEAVEFKADKFSIGGMQTEAERRFTLTVTDIQPGDKYYLYSDGFQDQFGGDRGRKYMTKRFRELLGRISDDSVEAQHSALEKEIVDWMGARFEQLDDVLVIGIKF